MSVKKYSIPLIVVFSRLDFTCVNNVIIECKAVSKLSNEHRSQLFNYMHLTKYRVGILVNFAPTYMEVERYFYDPEQDEIVTYNGEKLKTSKTSQPLEEY